MKNKKEKKEKKVVGGLEKATHTVNRDQGPTPRIIQAVGIKGKRRNEKGR